MCCCLRYGPLKKVQVASLNDVYITTYEGNKCVLKEYDLCNAARRQRVEREILRLSKLHHPNIVRIKHAFREKSNGSLKVYLHLPFYGEDNLKQWLLRPTPPSPTAHHTRLPRPAACV